MSNLIQKRASKMKICNCTYRIIYSKQI